MAGKEVVEIGSPDPLHLATETDDREAIGKPR